MITLFPNTGIQIIQLHYDVLTEVLQSSAKTNFNPEYLVYLLKREWTPISFDGKAMDYARIYWRFGLVDIARKGSNSNVTEAFSPLLAFDTTTGSRQYGQLDEAYDVGHTLNSSNIAWLIPNDDGYFRAWLNAIHERKKMKDPGFKEEWKDEDPWFSYKEYLKHLVTSLSESKSEIIRFRENTESKKHIAGQINYHSPIAEEDMDVNVYLDFGNSRSTCLFVEGNARATKLKDVVYPIEIVDYDKILNQSFSPGEESEEYIFDSRVEFRESMFQHQEIEDGSHSFRSPSIVCVGKEATFFGNKSASDDKSTGMSAPKRYLWDDEKRSDNPWHFSNGRRATINGKILESFEEYGVDRPPTPKHSRSRMTSFFILEVLNQAFSQMNSYKHRLSNETQRRRRIKRLVLTYPSGWTRKMKKDLLDRAQEGADKFADFMGIPPIVVELGLDEASASQIVFLESQIRMHAGNLADFGEDLFFQDNQTKFRIASIDIGGGTTDMMIAEYDLQNKTNTRLEGKILHADGTSLGGDDIVKRIIEEYLLPQFKSNSAVDEDEFNAIFYGEGPQRYRPIRLRCMNVLLRPLCHRLLSSLETNEPIDNHETALYDLVTKYVGATELNELQLDLKNDYKWDIKTSGSNPFQLPTQEDLIELIKKSSLKKVLDSYSKFISKFKPSFVLLTGKISSIEAFQEIVQSNHPVPKDRILPLGSYAPGKWYPYLKGGLISDAKTTVVVGMALSDIAQHLKIEEGCNVCINDTDTSNINFLGAYQSKNSNIQLSERSIILSPDSKESDVPLIIQNDLYLIYRNLNDERLHCGTLKKIGFKRHVFPKSSNLPSVFLRRADDDKSEIEISKENVSGYVLLDDKEIELTGENLERFVYIKDQTITSENYFLDTGEFNYKVISL
jgi:hypothetical protein